MICQKKCNTLHCKLDLEIPSLDAASYSTYRQPAPGQATPGQATPGQTAPDTQQ